MKGIRRVLVLQHIETTGGMINKSIKEDKEFVFRELGANGQEILNEENKKYIDKTFFKRKLLISKLFELLDN